MIEGGRADLPMLDMVAVVARKPEDCEMGVVLLPDNPKRT